MDEEKIQERRRDQDEKATQQRAAILGLQYLDTRTLENDLPLAKGILENADMYKGHIVPLVAGGGIEPFRFGVTSQTPQSLIKAMENEYSARGDKTQFLLISGSAFREFMKILKLPKRATAIHFPR